MSFQSPKIYFLGSGKIAVPVLSTLCNASGITVAGIGTQVDRPAGRDRKMTPTPVGEWCQRQGLNVDKPVSVNTPEFIEHMKLISPDMVLVVSFGQLLKENLLSLPKFGCINLHASLLPAYRGASPICSALLNGDSQTGVSFMQMEKGLDTGPVFAVYEYEIKPGQKADDLEEALGMLGAGHAAGVLAGIASGKLKSTVQDHSKATKSGKIKKENGEIDWTEPADLIERKLRAYHPWPGIFFSFEHSDREYRLLVTELLVRKDVSGPPGKVVRADKEEWMVACGSGAVSLEKVVPQGKKEMSGVEFLRGCHGLEDLIFTKRNGKLK